MSGIRYVVAGMRDQPEHPDLPGQVVAHVCLNARIGLSFVPDPHPGSAKLAQHRRAGISPARSFPH